MCLGKRPEETDGADQLMKQLALPYHLGRPPKAVRKSRLDNVALVPASLLPRKGKYQRIANNLPKGGVQICQTHKKTTDRSHSETGRYLAK
jgi:hypothetical protein